MTAWVDPLLTLAALAGYGTFHSLLTADRAKHLARRMFGPAASRLYRLGYNMLAVVTLLPILAMVAARPGQLIYRLDWPFLLLPSLGQAVALLTLAAGFLQSDPWHLLGLRQLTQPNPAEPPQLVVTGLYRWVRHPMYTAGLAFLWLTPVLTASLLAFNLGVTVYILIGSELEERRLLAAFGRAYADYRSSVPRLIPCPLHTFVRADGPFSGSG